VSLHSSVTKIQPPDSSVPVILRVQVSGTVGTGVIKARPPRLPKRPRRTFWQWLLRRRPASAEIAAARGGHHR
jgi:hypothetical protein